jgi:hypothetical protein
MRSKTAATVSIISLVATLQLTIAQSQCTIVSEFGTTSCLYLPSISRAIDTPTPTIPPPSPTPKPKDVVVKSSQRIFKGNTMYFYGEIANFTSNPIFNISVDIRFRDASGTILAADSAYTMLDRVDPDETAPFRVIVLNAPQNIQSADGQIRYANSTFTNYQKATILSQAARDASGVEIFGDLRNDLKVPLRFTQAIATFYEQDGTIAGADRAYIANPDTLPAGAVALYSIKTFEASLSGR